MTAYSSAEQQRKVIKPGQVMTALALSFPCLRDLSGAPVAGVDPWDAAELEYWASGPECDESALYAAQFVLAVFNRNRDWHCGYFDPITAVRIWDESNRVAFARWAENPLWRQHTGQFDLELPEVYTAQEAAEILNETEQTIREWCDDKKIVGVNINDQYQILKTSVDTKARQMAGEKNKDESLVPNTGCREEC